MKAIKKLTAVFMAFLLFVGVFAMGGSAANEHFFTATDPENNYKVYKDALDELGKASDSTSLYGRYIALQRTVNEPVVLDANKEAHEAAKAELAQIAPRVEALLDTLTIQPGETFIANKHFVSTSAQPKGKGIDPWGPADSIAWVNLRFEAGSLYNLVYSAKYNSPTKEIEGEDGNPEKVIDPEHPFYTLPVYKGVSAGTNVIDPAKTVFADVDEDHSQYIYPDTKQVFDHYTLGNFGYQVGSPFLADGIVDQSVLTVPDINGKALGFAPATSSAYSKSYVAYTGSSLQKNVQGSYPLLPRIWAPPATKTSYAYNRNTIITSLSPVVGTSTKFDITYYGAVDNKTVVDDLIPMDYVCEYKGVNGTANAVFDGWLIVGINNKPTRAGNEYSAGEPYNNYEITLEAKWKADTSNPLPVYEPATQSRTWNWLKERLRRWGFTLGEEFDEFGDPVPYTGVLLGTLVPWLVSFVDWVAEITNVGLDAILGIFGLDLGTLF